MREDSVNDALQEIQRRLFESNGGQKFDVYYKAGKGALAVPNGAAPIPDNVVLAVPDAHVQMYAAMSEIKRGGAA